MLPIHESDMFTSEEVGEIISLASELEDRSPPERLSWGQVVELAAELGVSPDALARARDVWAEGVSRQAIANRNWTQTSMRLERRASKLRGRATTFAIVVTGLAVLDWMTGTGWWVQWVALPWAILLARQAARLRASRRALGH